MCEWGTHVELEVLVHKDESHTGEFRIATKKIDACIAPIVKALNDAKIFTRESCCGHGKYNGYIQLHDGRVIVLMTEKEARIYHEEKEQK